MTDNDWKTFIESAKALYWHLVSQSEAFQLGELSEKEFAPILKQIAAKHRLMVRRLKHWNKEQRKTERAGATGTAEGSFHK